MLTTEAKVWSCYIDKNFDKKLWSQNFFNSPNSGENIGWTLHFCKPALMMDDGTTTAWPNCDPVRTKCNGGKLDEEHMGKRYEWACFNAPLRDKVGYKGISFDNWIKVKFGEAQLTKMKEMEYRCEWAKANFLRDSHYGLTPYVAVTVWDQSKTSFDKGEGGTARPPTQRSVTVSLT